MSEFLYRAVLPNCIGSMSKSVTGVEFTHYNGNITLKFNYTTTEREELSYVLLKDEYDGIYKSDANSKEYFILTTAVYKYTLYLSGTTWEMRMYDKDTNVYKGKGKSGSLEPHDDLIIYKKHKYYIEGDPSSSDVFLLHIKTGHVSEVNGKIWDVEIDYGYNYDYKFGYAYKGFSPSTNSSTFYGLQTCHDISNLGGGVQLIDPTLSTKSVSKYIGGQEYRLLTEDMVVDPIKVDTSKALVIDEDAPRVLTEECLSVASTINTKDHQLHPKVNPAIQIDDTCLGCEKLGRD